MSIKNRIRSWKTVRKGLAIILLLVLSITLPVMSFTLDNTFGLESSPIQYLPSADIPEFNLSYTSRTNLIDTPIKSGDTVAGDHVILKAEWTPSLVNSSKLEIHAPAIPRTLTVEDNLTTLQIDTRVLGNNATCSITSTAWLSNGSILTVEFTNVYIGNYFVPKVLVLSPNGNETWTSVHNIIWTASDINFDDELLYDVLYSSDSGLSFETLIAATNLTWFEWDCSSLIRMDTYIVRVRVTDGIYYSTDHSDNTFTAGTVVTTTTTPPTTTPTPGLEPRIIVFVGLLLFSSAVMALVVYYAARKWF
ncbi:MAG: hypothetical protein ACW99H_03920 [Candidatus Thorarchaeota archaeon]|jgi:hypothetical protein